MYIVRLNKEYRTIKEADAEEFFEITKDYDCEIITDKPQMKSILETHFASQSRYGKYKKGLPSVTDITDKLFPLDLRTQAYLILYMAKQAPTEGGGTVPEHLSKGNYTHKVLELYYNDLTRDTEHMAQYLREIRQDGDYVSYVGPDYPRMALKTLKPFLRKEGQEIIPVHTELFLSSQEVQGTIDLIANIDGEVCLCDYKTTSKLKNGKRFFQPPSQMKHYLRQLYLYSRLYNAQFKEGIDRFRIYQFHLGAHEYKIRPIPNKDIAQWRRPVEHVLKWYWDIRNS